MVINMGYQNNARPENDMHLLNLDVKCDLDDLKNDIKNNVSKEQLLKAVNFISESMKLLVQNSWNMLDDEENKIT